MHKRDMANTLTRIALQTMAFHFNFFPSFRKYLKTDDGWLDFTIGLRTEKGNVEQAISFRDGKARVYGSIPEKVDTEMVFCDNAV